MKSVQYKNIDEYIASFPEHVQLILGALRKTIRQAVPEATEVISYQMPAFKLHSVLVYFAAYERHIGFYPTASGVAAFQKEISTYKNSKGAIQFPIDKPLPFDLITKIVKFRAKEDAERMALKAVKKK